MIDNDTEYRAMQKQCNNTLYQKTLPSYYDKKKWPDAPEILECPSWVFGEEYALSLPVFELDWHTPGCIDCGIYCHVRIKDGVLIVETRRDGIIDMGRMDYAELPLERFANRMIQISVDANLNIGANCDWGSGKIQISYFNDPDYDVWNVQYVDDTCKKTMFVNVRARSENEAKVIAWKDSCCNNHDINPEHFVANRTNPHIITRASVKLFDEEEMGRQLAICEHYDKENK